MDTRILSLGLPLVLALVPVRPVAAQTLATGRAVDDCQRSVGNASLDVGGLAQTGGVLRLKLGGEPLEPFLLLLDTDDSGYEFGGLALCVGSNPVVLADGFSNPFFVIPPSGTFEMDLPIPDDPSLVGQSFFLQGLVSDATSPNGLLAVSNLAGFTIKAPEPIESLFFDDFEAGWGNWWVSNGTWEIGVPTSGPSSSWSGVQCAATRLAGNFSNTNTRLVSEAIYLPLVGPAEELRVNYQAWFCLSDSDSTTLQVSVDGGQTWATPACTISLSGTSSGVWTQASANLTEFAGQTIVLGFKLSSGGYYSCTGTYVDDVRVFRGTPFFESPQDWEDGIGDWWTVSRGTWEVGVPTSGPGSAHSGSKCAATRLDGNFTNNSSRLTSPPLELPAGGSPQLWFWHWFSLNDSDYGYVDVSVDGGCSWTNLASYTGTSSGTWTKTMVPLTAYAGQTVRLGFRMQTGGYYSSHGWFIDEIEIK